jgi:putative iron-regulated protein
MTPRVLPVFVLTTLLAGCGSDSDHEKFSSNTAETVIADYKRLVRLNYAEVIEKAEALQDAVDEFVAAPSASRQQAAKDAWIAARVPYGPSEVFRFYDGPIDNPEDGPEGLINAWPLDENYIDYTRDDAQAGLINDTAGVPQLTAEVIESANEAEGEAAISTGYHAIEFLLWGQDDATPGSGAGKRPYTDYLSTGASAPNAARRGTYLKLVGELLVSHLRDVEAQWASDDDDNFAAHFGVDADPDSSERDPRKQAISKLLRSIGSLAKAELAGERMTVAYKNRSEEDEHSCFSDNTAADLHGNGVGIQNVWLGRYGDFDGVGLDELVAKTDASLAEQTTQDIADALAKLEELVDLSDSGTPIDVVIQEADGSPERRAMLAAIEALRTVGDDIELCATALGLSVQLEEPSEEL